MIILIFKKGGYNFIMCFYYRDKYNVKGEVIFNYVFVVMFWLIFLLIIFLYIKIGKNLLRIFKRRLKFFNFGKYVIIVRNFFIVLIISIVCFVFYYVFRFVYIFL